MDKLIIEGGRKLFGDLVIQGSKNSALPILAASVLPDNECVIGNCPVLMDTCAAMQILNKLGCNSKLEGNTVVVNSGGFNSYEIPDSLMRKMRSSVIFLGAILAKCNHAKVSFPGGCELGPRPIDLHLQSLSKMGVKIKEEFGYLVCECPYGLHGAEIALSFPSVGATENIMLAATLAKGTTTITNAAKEPEIEDLQNFLNKLGAKIKGAGSGNISIEGVKKLRGAVHNVLPDRIATATYLIAVSATGGKIEIKNCAPEHLMSVLTLLSECGNDVTIGKNFIVLEADKRPRAVKSFRTMPYPGFPTDAQAPMMALMSIADGSSVFVETIFENRFKHTAELMRMGAKIKTEGRVAVVEGVERLYGATVEATDLRGGAALAIAGLTAVDNTVIDKILHIDRGYENFEKCLASLGAEIRRE